MSDANRALKLSFLPLDPRAEAGANIGAAPTVDDGESRIECAAS
jgi:hypothetical protein